VREINAEIEAKTEYSDTGQDVELLSRWGGLVAALVFGGLMLASRAADDYTYVFGFLLAGFGVLIGGRLLARVRP
jgi:hypothetical protein